MRKSSRIETKGYFYYHFTLCIILLICSLKVCEKCRFHLPQVKDTPSKACFAQKALIFNPRIFNMQG